MVTVYIGNCARYRHTVLAIKVKQLFGQTYKSANINVVRKFLCPTTRDNRKLGQATLTDFHRSRSYLWMNTSTTPQSLRVCMAVSRLSLQFLRY